MTATIDAVRVLVVDAAPGDDTCFVAVCAAGDTGWYGPVSAEVGRYVNRVLAKSVVGESPADHHRLHAAMRRAAGPDTAEVASWAVGAVDCAAWDLHGRLVRVPVADLLVSSPRPAVPLYASWLGLNVSLPTTRATLERVGTAGWTLTKWGLRRGPDEDAGLEAARLAETTRVVAVALGAAAAFDAVFTWDVALAELVAERVDPANVLWLEDPLPSYDLEAYRALAGGTPWAVGERLFVHADGHALLDLRPRAFTLDVVACGGLSRAVELVAAAVALGVPVYPHGRSFVPAVHLAAAYPDAVPAVEYRLQWEPVRQQRYAMPWRPNEGMINIPTSPGLGAAPRSH